MKIGIKNKRNGYRKNTSFVPLAFLMIFISFSANPTMALADSCPIDISDTPLETLQDAATANIMFIVDTSGSMDIEFLTPLEEGKLNGVDEYLFDGPDHGYYGSSGVTGTTGKRQWEGQWSEFNKLFYHPGVVYNPWMSHQNPSERMADADLDNPKANPLNDTTFNLNDTFIKISRNAVAVSVRRSGNGTSTSADAVKLVYRGSQTGVDDIVVDDDQTSLVSKIGQWSESGSTAEYDGDSKYTTDDNATWTWYLSGVTVSGPYDVYIWAAPTSNRDSQAVYTVYSGNETRSFTVDQRDQSNGGQGGQWYRLGTRSFNFDAPSGPQLVKLVSNDDNYKYADLLRLEPVDGGSTIDIDNGDPEYDETGSTWTTSSNYSPHEGPNYRHNHARNSTATWTLEDRITSEGNYKVYVKIPENSNSYMSENVTYEIHHSNSSGDTVITVLTDVSHKGYATVDGNGLKYLGEYYFKPRTGAVETFKDTIIRAHYYIWSDKDNDQKQENGEIYLVEFDGTGTSGDINYYRFDDKNRNDLVEVGELSDKLTGRDIPASYNRLDDPGTDITLETDYGKARQNFANWYCYYRRRSLAAKAAIGETIANLENVKAGLVDLWVNHSYNEISIPCGEVTTRHKKNLLQTLYEFESSGRTPLRSALMNVGRYFDARSGAGNGGIGPAPYENLLRGGACQQNFAIMMTDGYYNDSPGDEFERVGNRDKDGGTGDDDTEFDGGVYEDDNSDTLADIAMKYYEEDLNSRLADGVPSDDDPPAHHQHMNTYTVSFGVAGNIQVRLINEVDPVDASHHNIYNEWLDESVRRGAWKKCPEEDCPDWPGNSSDEGKIDDLFHAAVNGRGLYVPADDPESLVQAFNDIMQSIDTFIGSAAAVSLSSMDIQQGAELYRVKYETGNWWGDVLEHDIDQRTGSVSQTSNWSAKTQLAAMDWDSGRRIITYSGSSGVPFRYDRLTQSQKQALDSNPETARKMLNYIRGDTSEEGSLFRTRNGLLGDIVHSSPIFFNGIVYVGANDGMLHAFDTATGNEVFAYVPGIVFDHLKDYADPFYRHRYFVDNTPYVQTLPTGKTLLISGLGKGGKGYFCLDITDIVPGYDAENQSNASGLVKWEFSNDNDSDMGYSMGKGFIVNTRAGTAAVFGNGYNSDNGKAVIFFVDADTGITLRKIDTGAGNASNCNGLSTPVLTDPINNNGEYESDGIVDYAYAGDLQGNLWKFDLTDSDPRRWDVFYKESSSKKPLFQAKNNDGTIQPITTQPDVIANVCADMHGSLVVFGTGRYFNVSDLADTSVQSLYLIWDWADEWKELGDTYKDKYFGYFDSGSPRRVSNANRLGMPNGTESLAEITVEYSVPDTNPNNGYGVLTRVLSETNMDWFNPEDGSGTHVGWYFDLPAGRERIIADPLVRNGNVIFVTMIPSDSPCAAGGSSMFHEVDACTGRLDAPPFDTNQDDAIDAADLLEITIPNPDNPNENITIKVPPNSLAMEGILQAPAIAGLNQTQEMKYFGTSSQTSQTGVVEVVEQGIRTGVFSWEEVR